MRAAVAQIVADELRGTTSKRQRGVNTAAGQRRHQAGRIADQERASTPERRNRSTGWDKPAAPLHDVQMLQSKSLFDLRDERAEIRLAAKARGNADLCCAMAGNHPADIAGGEPAVGEAMQEPGVDRG